MRNILASISKEEIDSLELITTKISCSKQALKITPEGTDEDKKYYVQSILDSIGNYTWLESDWWNSILNKYDIINDRSIYVDFITGELYSNEQ